MYSSSRGSNSKMSSNHRSSSHGSAAHSSLRNSDPMELLNCVILHFLFLYIQYKYRNSDISIINAEPLFLWAHWTSYLSIIELGETEPKKTLWMACQKAVNFRSFYRANKTVESAVSTLRKSTESPNEIHRQTYFQIGNCHFGLQCAVTVHGHHLYILIKKLYVFRWWIRKFRSSGTQMCIYISQFGHSERWEERGTGQT